MLTTQVVGMLVGALVPVLYVSWLFLKAYRAGGNPKEFWAAYCGMLALVLVVMLTRSNFYAHPGQQTISLLQTLTNSIPSTLFNVAVAILLSQAFMAAVDGLKKYHCTPQWDNWILGIILLLIIEAGVIVGLTVGTFVVFMK